MRRKPEEALTKKSYFQRACDGGAIRSHTREEKSQWVDSHPLEHAGAQGSWIERGGWAAQHPVLIV